MKEKVVLAYSGGLDTSIIVPWLKENYDLDIIAACVNVGQEDDMKEVKEKALASGAVNIYIENVQEEFVADYVFTALKANAVYEDKYLLGTSIARPLIAKKLVEIAHKEGAKYIAHGCTGKGNDQVRFETTIAAIDPSIKIIAPWREWDIKSREDAIDYANEMGIEVPVTKEKIYSRDQNLLHISHEGGDIEDVKNEHKADILYMMTKTLEEASDEPTYVTIHFEKGIPTKVDGEELSPVEILSKLNEIGGDNGVGVVDLLENRLVGMKSRGIYETPGGSVLMFAHKELEHLVLDKMTYQYKQMIGLKYAELVYNGVWFSTLKESLDAFIDKTQENVTGWVKLKLYKGNIIPAGMDSKYKLYNQEISSFGHSDLYDQSDAGGFINLFNLPFKIKAMMDKDL
ncbi:argininosuccinate synthase [Anaeromicrobium sediminis]|uniref:Argininosuccinate synthase n=1 Tax=Anaeromicrobium sediminis TaxID=1478221 RepID=A0A267MGR1_9FIRM|nr:argininosuccinate synthase [Anaeromicrobium sediminis]PAB58065.1 argininosuccinate synthase [Anaeromicrobium sediminis]